ncbi:Toxin ParE1 [Symmachiella macrocystis]|uniref:Toxin ParE1 n=1 Tax=Symmachiella macrocystis TaxID=2527985 RepID=A0A5C6BKI9_9PLAN|nr:type II toxin-antitoxin system RelE/ParE family toxin [Symmachiella macrocystis]TWU12167.1 Toxin ParE1 [Symmachiella macrocystis]
MSRGYRLSPQAQSDLDQIWDFIAADNPKAASNVIHKFDARFQMLVRQPLIGESREELLSGLRSFPVGSYVIYYRLLSTGRYAVEIARVLHGARDIHEFF